VRVDVIEISAAAAAGGGGAASEDEFFQALDSAEQLIDQCEALSTEEIPEKMRSRDKPYSHLTLVEPWEETTAEWFDSVV
jgi:hypothetical protein